MEQAVRHAPLLPRAIEGDGLVVEADDAAAALLVVAADEADAVADGDLVAAEALARLLADVDVGGDAGRASRHRLACSTMAPAGTS
ncbi:MAG TPA: hypothetical protein PK889_00795, partial [Thauera aminoaromatica]|nr:hypothetical protein [Thauera aminoaromatica]